MRRLLCHLAILLLTVTLVAMLAVALVAQGQTYDVIVRGGRVVDGSGNPWFLADVGVRNGRIAAVGQLGDARAGKVIDATGLTVAPGFIDLHTHSEMPLLADGTAQSKVRQGVTLDIMGESSSVAPRDGLRENADAGGPAADWTTFTGYFQRLERQGISMNVISHVARRRCGRL